MRCMPASLPFGPPSTVSPFSGSAARAFRNGWIATAKFWRKLLVEIQEGEKQLDGTYKRFFAATSSWNVESVLNGANSL